MTEKFYLESKWKRIREVVLRRDGYMDQERKRYGKFVSGNIVHHIFPRESFPEYEYEVWNLITLSAKTHNEMHDRNTNKLTKKGMELLVRTARRKGLEDRVPKEPGLV